MAEEEKKAVTHASLKPKNGFQRAAEVFLTDDIESAKEYAWRGVIIPGIKKAVLNIIARFLDTDASSYSNTYSKITGSVVSYADYYKQKTGQNTYTPGSEYKRKASYQDPIVDTPGEAHMVLDRMNEMMRQYNGIVRVIDLYDMVDLPTTWTDPNYGWRDISAAKVLEYRGKYIIKMPPPYPLK